MRITRRPFIRFLRAIVVPLCLVTAMLAALSPWRGQWTSWRSHRVVRSAYGTSIEEYDTDLAVVEGYLVVAVFSELGRLPPGPAEASLASPVETRERRRLHEWMRPPGRDTFILLGVQRGERRIDTFHGFAYLWHGEGNWAIVMPAWYVVLFAILLAIRSRLPRWRLFHTGLRTAEGRCRVCSFPLAPQARRCPVCRTSARAPTRVVKLGLNFLTAHVAGSWAWFIAILAMEPAHSWHAALPVALVQFFLSLLLVFPYALFDAPFGGGEPLFIRSLLAYAVVGCVMYIHLTRRPAAAVRWARGCCPRCGYDLQGNLSGICPECGQRWRPEACGNAL